MRVGAGGRGGDRDRSEELDRDALAEIDVIDAEIEEEVHQRRGDAEDGGAGEVTARPSAVEAGRDREQRDRRPHHAEPGDGLRFDLVEQRHRDRGTDVLRDRGEQEQRLGRRRGERAFDATQTGRHGGGQSNSSGSVRQISCQSGWNENQPASE